MSVVQEPSPLFAHCSGFSAVGSMLRQPTEAPSILGGGTALQKSFGVDTEGATPVVVAGFEREGPQRRNATYSPMCNTSGFHGAKDTIEVTEGSFRTAIRPFVDCSASRVLTNIRPSVRLCSRTGNASMLIAGNKESPGYRSKMEDFTCIQQSFVRTRLLHGRSEVRIPEALREGLCDLKLPEIDAEGLNVDDGSEPLYVTTDDFHFAAVYDGHGGTDVAEQLSLRLHDYIAEAVRPEHTSSPSNLKSLEAGYPMLLGDEARTQACYGGEDARPYTAGDMYIRDDANGMYLQRSGSNEMDIESNDSTQERWTATSGDSGDAPCTWGDLDMQLGDGITDVLRLDDLQKRLVSAFEKMNAELPSSPEKTVGSTAVVAMVSAHHVVVANVGDSRAVLRRNGMTFRLSRDHKPDEQDEEDRITESGGRVWDFNGRRVMGLLAMTRAFGDDCLKPFGICATPEVTILPRTEGDEFMILACDGLWDVVSDEEASSLVQRCFKRAQERDACPMSACRVAASVLFRAAFAKGSNDNISVVVVDLRSHHETSDQKVE